MDAYDVVARYYDAEHASWQDDVPFYQHLAAAHGSPILVLGAGTGRVVAPLVTAGHDLWALDRSAAMLERMRETLGSPPRVHYVQADMTSFRVATRFALIVSPLDTFSHLLTVSDQLAALERIREHLAPGGLAVLDLINPYVLPVPERAGLVRERFRGDLEGSSLTVWESSEGDLEEQRLTLHLTYDSVTKAGLIRERADVEIRWSYRFEIEHLCARVGLDVCQVYGNYDLAPYADGCPRLIVTTMHAQAQEEERTMQAQNSRCLSAPAPRVVPSQRVMDLVEASPPSALRRRGS